MKQVTNRIVDLFKGLKTSAVLGQRDSEIELPNRVMSIVELPGPIKNGQNASTLAIGTVVSDSAYFSLGQSHIGAAALSQIFTNSNLDAGLWHIKGFGELIWTVAAINAGVQQNVGLIDPEGFTIVLAQAFRATLTGVVHHPIDLLVSLDRPGWRFISQIDATLAGDTVFSAFSLLADKLL